jgi:solute carrier family 35 protein E1
VVQLALKLNGQLCIILFILLIFLTFIPPPSQVGLVAAWYAGNTLYNIYNKKATNMIHAHWFVAAAQLFVGIVWSVIMWVTGLRKAPNLTAADIAACVPIGLFACLAHAGSVLAVSASDVT